MINKSNKNESRKQRKKRVQRKIFGTSKRPRLNVYRSTKHIHAQIIDDTTGSTLVSVSTLQPAISQKAKDKTKKEQAQLVGEEIAKKAKEAKVKKVVFDRAGYVYMGRVRALAEAARNAGLDF